MILISGINDSGLYAVYSVSAEKDNAGNVITATYMKDTLFDFTDSDEISGYNGSAFATPAELSAGTDLKIENGIISVNTNGTANSADMAFVEGSATIASGKYSHAEGCKTSAIGTYTHAEGLYTKAAGEESHAEGWGTFASGHNSHAEGNYTTAAGTNSHAEGYQTLASGLNSHAEGDSTRAIATYSHAEGAGTKADNTGAHAEGNYTFALGYASHAEGAGTKADNTGAHAEGNYTSALGYASHAEGNYTSALGAISHAEGLYTSALGDISHAEGLYTSALGVASHAEGSATLANGSFTHAEGYGTSALLTFSHAEGNCTIASSYAMHAGGMYNKTSADALFVLGNGSAESARSDAFVVTSAGLASATTLATSGIPDIEAAITSIPAQVQTDWKETNTASPAYIQNKPVDLEMSAGDGISITEVNDTLVFAVSGNYADATEVDTYYGKKTNDVYYIKPDLPYDLYSSTATYNIGDKVVLTAGSGSLYSAKSAVTTPGAWSTNSGKFAGVSNVVFTAENEDITELYDGLKIALYLPSRLASSDSYLNINGLGDVPLFKNNNIKLTSGYFPTSGVVIYFTYVSATNRWVWADYDSNSTYAGMVDAYVNLSASATNLSATCTNFSAKPGNTINVTFTRNYTAVSAKQFRAGTTTYQPLYLNGSATSNTNYFIPSGTWPVYYDGNNWYLWTDGSIQFSAIRGTVIDCVKYNDIQYAIGTSNTATGSTTSRYSVALGNSNSAYNSFVIGNYNKGKESHIFGVSNSGINSYIVGYNCTGTESYLFGKDLSGKSWGIELGDFGDTCYPVIVGNKNETKTSAYFVVGCGNTLGNADAFIVSSNKVASAADFLAGNGVSLSSLKILSAGTDLKIENDIISVNTDGTSNSADMAFVEGSATLASGQCSHAEGCKTSAIGTYTHAEGVDTKAAGEESHAEGWGTFASGHNSHAECSYTTAAGTNSHAEGYKTLASGLNSHAEGDSTSALGPHSHAEGQFTITNDNCAHAEGQHASAMSLNSHAEGGWTIANDYCSHAEGNYTSALGYASHTEGFKTNATTSMGHAEGNFTSAFGEMSHAEGNLVLAQGIISHAEGSMTTAFGAISHAEGEATLASGGTSHAEGTETSALDYASHSEGYCTIAASPNMHAGGMYNKTSADALFVLGNGSAESARSDAFVVTSAGLASATTLATSGIPDIEAAITSIPAQVQADWAETVTSNPAYIQNKPDVLIPVDSPAALGGISKPTNIMVVSALPASPDSATIYLVQGTMIGN